MNEVVSAVEEVAEAYHRLVLLVAPIASGKSERLAYLASQQAWPLLNVNQVVAERLLELNAGERAIKCKWVLSDAISGVGADTVVLDNIEMLFEECLRQDPLRLLQSLSRSRTLLVGWPGHFDGRHLTFADPGHRDYRKYDDPEARVVTMQPA